jgi:nitroreductase
MRLILVILGFISLTTQGFMEARESITLNAPSIDRGLPVMQALSLRASVSEFDSKELELQDLSDLVWAAYGINRPESGKRTAPTAYNTQDIDLYIVIKEGIYIYDALHNKLNLIVDGDHRAKVAHVQASYANAPVFLVMVSDQFRFEYGDDQQKRDWGAMSAGIISQNISIFCAGTDLVTRPRATMDHEALSELLYLDESLLLLLNHPVSYEKE